MRPVMRHIAGLPLIAAAAFAALAPVAARAQDALTVELRPVPRSEQVWVGGKAPAGRPVELRLVAAFSKDLPDTLVRRVTVTPGADGSYAVVMPIAPAFARGTVLTVVASAADGTTRTSNELVVAAPRATDLPLDKNT